MRKLLALPLICLLAALAVPAAAAAAIPPTLPRVNSPLLAVEDETEASDSESDDEAEAEEKEDEEGEVTAENCEIEDEEDVQLCAEIAREERELAEEEKCVLESASASVDANPGSGKVRLNIRYTTYAPAPFSLRYALRGSKGGLQLGNAKARFSRAGAFHDVVRLSDRKMAKVLAAREFQIELRALNTPSSCRERLSVQRRGASRLHWSS